MNPREVCLGVIDGRHEGEKLELLCRERESGTVEVELRLLAWGEGIGWYSQRALPLTSLDRVAKALGVSFEQLLRFPVGARSRRGAPRAQKRS